jgi:hypothetical protein
MSGEHAKRVLITREKPGSSGKKNEEKTPSKDVDHKHKEEKMNLLAPSSHTRRAIRRKRR